MNKKYLMATAALVALSAQAQLSGPNRTGPGTSPGTFQTPGGTDGSINGTNPDLPKLSVTPPTVESQGNFKTTPLPKTSVGTPDATGGPITDSLRTRSSFPSSQDWERGAVGGQDARQSGTDSGRLTPPSGINPNPRPLQGTGTSLPGHNSTLDTLQGVPPGGPQPVLRSDLNTSGVNTPPASREQPLDQALSAKIRAQLSQKPSGRSAAEMVTPETVRDLRITSRNGRIVLEGMVNTLNEKQMIEAQAKQVPGVVGIENRVVVGKKAIGAPASSQSGQAQSPLPQTATPPIPGQSPQNADDLNDKHPEIRPEL